MSQQLPSLSVAARSEAPCTSNQCLFHVADLPQLVFCAHAVEGGTIVVQQVCEMRLLRAWRAGLLFASLRDLARRSAKAVQQQRGGAAPPQLQQRGPASSCLEGSSC